MARSGTDVPSPAAHTAGDTIAFFRAPMSVSTGDIFVTNGYPIIDLKTAAACKARSTG